MKKIKSQSKGFVAYGNVDDIIRKYEGKAYEQLSLKNFSKAHYYFQHAEHYRRQK